MRKRITVFVVLMMVVCLALAGCAQNTSKQEADRPGENFDTVDSSIMDGTNNPDGSTSEHEAITDTNDESIPDGAAEEAARNGEDSTSSTGDNTTPNGMYSWQVGNYTLTTKINVMDYIDGNVWYANEMAAALGWDPIAFKRDGTYQPSMSVKAPVYYRYNDEITIRYDRTGSSGVDERCNGISGTMMSIPIPTTGDGYIYDMNESGVKWTLDGIICFAYACEQLPNSPNDNPFANIFSNGTHFTD